jgi:NAD(P)-dependent dehydrogenase (short-subunit alcohol dehydrogenase family)
MRRQRAGHIINFSSLGGFRASAGWGVYCSTKFAAEGITEALHDELAPLGLHATVIEPGFFRTDFMDNRSLARTGQQIGATRERSERPESSRLKEITSSSAIRPSSLKQFYGSRTPQTRRCG